MASRHRDGRLLLPWLSALAVLLAASYRPVAMARVPTSKGASRALNFAFGSNMDESTRMRRQLQPTQILPAVANGWELFFSLPGVPFLEPAFATLRPADGSISTHGVCLDLDRESWFRLLASEGVLGAADIKELRTQGASLEEVLERAAKTGQDVVRGYRLLPIEAGLCCPRDIAHHTVVVPLGMLIVPFVVGSLYCTASTHCQGWGVSNQQPRASGRVSLVLSKGLPLRNLMYIATIGIMEGT